MHSSSPIEVHSVDEEGSSGRRSSRKHSIKENVLAQACQTNLEGEPPSKSDAKHEEHENEINDEKAAETIAMVIWGEG